MASILLYKIAGHRVRLLLPSNDPLLQRLDNYAPFTCADTDDSPLFEIAVTNDEFDFNSEPGYIGLFPDDAAAIEVWHTCNGYIFRIGPHVGETSCTMHASLDFSHARVYLCGDARMRFFGLNNCLMLLYAFASAQHDTVLMHASVIKNNGKGYLFLGKSGTGKSTHSSLWLEHINGSELLNDDNPVVRIINGKAIVFGSPWSGKTPCYRNESVPLAGIVKLRQAPVNEMKRLSRLQAYAAILPSCSCMKWENDIKTGIHSTIEKLTAKEICFELDCLPDKAAAMLCYKTISK